MPKVKVFKDGKALKEIEVAEGANLRTALLENGIPVHHDVMDFTTAIVQYVNCHGLGQCGTCHVHVKSGMENCSPKGWWENLRLKMSTFAIGHEDVVRLSCQTKVMGDMEVEVQPKINFSGEPFWEMKPPSFSGAKKE